MVLSGFRSMDHSSIPALHIYSPPPTQPTTNPAGHGEGKYSNFGFERLADIVMVKAGAPIDSYEQWVRERIFFPVGITRPVLASHRIADADPTVEVPYHTRPAWGTSTAPDGPLGPATYDGGTYFPLTLGAGGWSMSAVDYARFLSHIDSPGPILQENESVKRLFERKYAKNSSLGFGLTTIKKKLPLAPQPYIPAPHFLPPAPIPAPGNYR